jgi:hypothetical protein
LPVVEQALETVSGLISSGLASWIRSLWSNALWTFCALTASDEPPIHELQHLYWNCFLVKILAFETTAKRNLFSNTGGAFIFESDNSDIFAARFVPNNISGFKIGVHWVPLGRVKIYSDDADHITVVYQDERRSRWRLWGHETFLENSLPRARTRLCHAGFLQSSESMCVLTDSENGWKFRLLEDRPKNKWATLTG